MKKIIVVLMLMTTSAHASGIGVSEFRIWTVCQKEGLAISIAKLFADGEFQAAQSAWHTAVKNWWCDAVTTTMTPKDVGFRHQAVDNTIVRVVRLTNTANRNVFWLTLEPVEGDL